MPHTSGSQGNDQKRKAGKNDLSTRPLKVPHLDLDEVQCPRPLTIRLPARSRIGLSTLKPLEFIVQKPNFPASLDSQAESSTGTLARPAEPNDIAEATTQNPGSTRVLDVAVENTQNPELDAVLELDVIMEDVQRSVSGGTVVTDHDEDEGVDDGTHPQGGVVRAIAEKDEGTSTSSLLRWGEDGDGEGDKSEDEENESGDEENESEEEEDGDEGEDDEDENDEDEVGLQLEMGSDGEVKQEQEDVDPYNGGDQMYRYFDDDDDVLVKVEEEAEDQIIQRMRDELDKRKGDGDGDVQMEVEDRPGEQADIEQMAVDPASVSKDISRTRKIPELYPPPTPQVDARANNAHNRLRTGEPIDVVRMPDLYRMEEKVDRSVRETQLVVASIMELVAEIREDRELREAREYQEAREHVQRGKQNPKSGGIVSKMKGRALPAVNDSDSDGSDPSPDPKHREPLLLQRQRDVRAHYDSILASIDPDNLEECKVPEPPSADEVRDFERDGLGGPFLSNLRLDFREGHTRGKWNHRAAVLFARSFQASKDVTPQDKKNVEKSFLSHLRVIRERYRREQNPNAPLSQKARDVKRRTRRRNRQRTTFKNRREGATLHRNLLQFERVLERLGIDGVSGDESDIQDGQPRYIIYQYDWRSPDLSEWLHLFDDIYDASKLNSLRETSRGNSSRVRVPTTTVHNTRPGKAVSGLPKNWYNQAWLKTLDEYQTEDLHMGPDVAMKHSDALEAHVEALKNKNSGRS